MTKKPSYRFTDYDEPWAEKKLGEVADFTKGKGYSKGDLEMSGIPIILYGRLYTNYQTIIDDVYTYVTMKEHSVLSEGNEIIVPSSGESSEEISRASVVEKNGVILGGDLNIIKLNATFSSVFVAITLSNGAQQKELSKRAQGKSVVHLHNSDLKEVNLSFPSLPEQTAIGSFFQDIDQLMSLQQRKLEVLKEQKKTYLKLLFPTKGQTKPALRFAGFEDEWQEVKLGDFVEISKGIQRNKEFLSPNADSKNCYPVYNGGKQESGYTDEFNREGNIMISEGGASAGFVNYFDGKYWSGGHNFTIDELENDIDYVLALLESQQQELYSLQVGSGLPNIQLNSLKKVIITFPAFLEQQAIGSFFQDLDKAIAKQV